MKSPLLPSEDSRIMCMALLNYVEELRVELDGVTNPDLRINLEWRIERAQLLTARYNQSGTFVDNEAH